MGIQLTLILIAILSVAIGSISIKVYQRKLDLQYSLTWFLLVIGLVVVVIFPQILTILSELLGIQTPINMIFFLGFLFILLLLFRLTILCGKMANEIKRLSQEVAIKEHHDE